MTFESIKSLIEHARTAGDEEAEVALDLASNVMRREKLNALATLIEAKSEELATLERLQQAVAYAVTSGQSTPEQRQLHKILSSKPPFNPEAGIRAAVPAFEWLQKHTNEISALTSKL